MFFLQGSSSRAPEEYLNFLLCEKFGWTFDELAAQPEEFISSMLLVMNTINKVRNKKIKES